MNIRCVCGNEVTISPARPDYYLKDEKWFDEETKTIKCPKCDSTQLPLELIDGSGSGPVKVRVVAGRTIANKGLWG